MANLDGFNANEVEPLQDFEVIPPGEYPAIIVDSEMKSTKSGDGHYLELSFQIVEGTYAGRHLWSRLNLENRSEKAVEIARAELSAVCRAVGVPTPKDSSDLHDIPMTIRVKCRKRADSGEIVNEVKGYSSAKEAGDAPAETSLPWGQR